jgi:glycosyltransferase involved in cell wall biosynthesis/tetratricopeptide (TPR) repeat protein
MSDKASLLGLNIIVGPDDKNVLERALKSCQGELFDEIVVTMAMLKEDPEIKALAESLGAKVFFFKWVGDFSLARNFSFSKNTTEQIMWIDSDDVIKPSEYKKLLELKPLLHKWDVVVMDYVYSHDEKDNPVLVLPRERIVKRCDHIKWHDPIHEYMNLDVPPHKINRVKIRIDHYRMSSHNPARNIEALKKVYESKGCSERIKFYYGKELADYGLWDKAISVLEPYIRDGKDFQDNLTNACIRLARYYIEKKDYAAAKTYALKGVRFNCIYAENYVILGTIFEQENDPDTAASYYKEALNKKLDGGMSQIVDYYGFIPSAKLALLYNARKEYDIGIKYCELALRYKPEDAPMLELLKMMQIEVERLSKGSVLKEEDIKEIQGFLSARSLNAVIVRNNYDFSDVRINRIRNLEIVWFLPILDLINPSIRIRRYNIHNKLNDMGVKSTIITNYYDNSIYEVRNMVGEASIAIFTQFSKKDLELMKHLKGSGIKCVFDHCEALFRYPFESECMTEASLITCCSTKLMELTNEQGFMHTAVLKDAVEKTSDKAVYANRDNRLKAVYVGMGGNSWLSSELLKDTIEEAGYDLVTITEWENASKKWHQDTWMDDMLECDVVLCPQRVDVQPAKSSVKATTAMALGLPVICSPLQAYKEIVIHGVNGFICDTKEEWKGALIKLKDPDLRKKVGEAGKRAVEGYGLDAITRQWITTLTDLINDRLVFKDPPNRIEVKDRPLVDVIIASYNNVEYLKLCVNSIQMNTLYPYHIIISDGGSGEETWEYLKNLKGITVIGEKGKRMSFSETCNAGIQASNTKYFVILNSDVIVSKCWLTGLVDKMETKDRLASCGVLSNCDLGWYHGVKGKPTYPMHLEKAGIDLHPAMKVEEIKLHVEELYKFMEESNKKHKDKFVHQEWVAAYATIFARCAVNEVGLFDPVFLNGCEDLDIMTRLSKYGYKTGQAIDSFIFHFGGISRGAFQEEDRASYDKEDHENHIKYGKKWAQPKIVLWTGPAWEPWNKAKVDEGMAGSETWASYLAREFVQKGFRTIIYNDLLIEDKKSFLLDPVLDTKGEMIGEVIYRDYRNMVQDLEYDVVDYFIASRSVEPLKLNIHALRSYVMVHDIWLSADKNYDTMSWRVDKYAYLSNWHRDFLSKHHGLLSDKMFLTANGQDMSLYEDVDTYTKKNQAVYSSSPDRGLYQLLHMLPAIRKEVPDFELVVAYGFFNWESMARTRNDLEGLNFIDKIKKLMDQPGVKYVGRISKKELAQYEKESKIWLYPTWFSETFSCTAVAAGLSKCSIVSTDMAGLQTTIGSAGALLPPDGLSRNGDYLASYTDRFISEAVKMLTDESYRKEWADKAYNKMKEYTWSNVADGWLKEFGIKK